MHYQQFLSWENFQRAWERVQDNQGCAGSDGETIAQFAERAELHLADLIRRLQQGAYRPLPLRQFQIPKRRGVAAEPSSNFRTLRVPAVRDRIVQQALLNVLHPLLDPQFEACSFAYRPGRSHLMAVRQVEQWRKQGYTWVLDADVVQYFDNVQHSRLFAEFAERINQPEFLALVQQWMTVGSLTGAGLMLPQKGVPQGAVVSPILANVYLDDFDEVLSATSLKLVRYADDFVLMGRNQQQVLEGQELVRELLQGMGLELHQGKTRVVDFEQGFRFLGHAFAGDLIVPLHAQRSDEAATHQPVDSAIPLIRYADPPVESSAMQQAMLETIEALKLAQRPIPPPLFVALGYAVREPKPLEIISDESIWSTGMSTLYLVQQGATLRKEQGRFLVRAEAGQQVSETEIPIREVEQVLVFGNVQLTTAAMAACLEVEIPVIFLSQLGDYKGHLWSAELGDLAAEVAQFDRRHQPDFQLTTARTIVQAKLWNSKQLLLKLNRKHAIAEVATAIAGLNQDWEAAAQIESAEALNPLRGYEGVAATRYFAALGRLIKHPGFTFNQRNRRPPTDPVNSLLSFGYTLLFNNVLSLILAEGLNPYLGNLHRSDRKQAHLAFDLMEEFRSPVVDTLVIKLINQKILRPTDFSFPAADGGVYLTDAARRVFLKQFEARLSLKLTHADAAEPVSYRRVIQLQVRRYKRSLLTGEPYAAFLRVT